MFYISTADRLQRTARWLEALPGGIKYLREVVLEDKLGICKDLEDQMSVLVSTYFCEWTEVVNDPAKQERFRQFANIDPKAPQGFTSIIQIASKEVSTAPMIDLADSGIEMVPERGQLRPAYWPSGNTTDGIDFRSLTWKGPLSWEALVHSSRLKTDVVASTSVAVKRGDTQLAIFNVRGRGYFATQQMCPHKRAFVLSDGLVGDDPTKPGQLWVSCPQHKRNFEIAPPTGDKPASAGGCLTDPSLSIKMFRVEERDDGMIYVELPPVEELDAILGTKRWIIRSGDSGQGPFTELDRKLEAERQQRAKGMKGRRGVKVAEREASCVSPPPAAAQGIPVGGGCGGAGVDW